MGESDISGKSGLSLTRLYSSYDDHDKVAGTFKLNYQSKIDRPLAENITSKSYATIEDACIEGWRDIEKDAFLGKLEEAQPIFNHVTSLCDIYDDGELLASLMTKHKRSGKSNHLHTLTRPDGSTYVFFKRDKKWKTISKTPLKLEETSQGFKLINLNDGVEEYSKEGKLLSITNAGQVTTLSYNPRGELSSVVNPFGQEIKLSYKDELLTEAISYDGTKVLYSYNEKKQLTKVTYEDGTTKSYGYNSDGDLESITDTNDIVTKTITYDGGKVITTAGINGINKTEFEYFDEKTIIKERAGDTDYHFMVKNSRLLTTKRVSDEGVSTTTYDSHGYPKLTTDKFGIVTKTTYDEEGLLVTKTTDADTPNQKITLTSYDVKFRKPTKVVKDGLVTFYDYDDNGKTIQKVVATVVMPNSEKPSAKSLQKFTKAMLKTDATQTQVSKYQYNEKGQKIGATQPNGATTSNEYDANGNQIKSTNALGYTTETLAFDKAGRPLKTKSFDGKISTTTYDKMGRVLESTNDKETTKYKYDSSGRNIKTTYSDGRVDEKKYDSTGNVVESWNNQGDKTKNYYDENNNLVKTETYKDDKLTNKNQTEYDSKNRVIANIDAFGNRTTYTYNSKGQKTETKDALGRVTKSVYNAKGQLEKTITPDKKETIYSYNAESQRSSVKTPNGAVFTFKYDSLGKVTSKGNPDRGTTTYTYDVSGNVLTQTNAKGEIKTYTYDIANRKTGVSYSSDATLNESYEYDKGENAKGKLTKITDISGSTAFEYNKDGNLITKTQTIDDKPLLILYTYDQHNRVETETYPSGKVIGYEYDRKGELVTVTIDKKPFIKDIKTNNNGLLSYSYSNGLLHTRSYDKNGRVTKLKYPKYTEKVDYNKVSNITKIKSDAISQAFGYDSVDRLTTYKGAKNTHQEFTYDANGNRLTQNQEQNSSKSFSYLAESNILESINEQNSTDTKEITYEYDEIGNIIKDEKHSYSYDGRSRLTSIDSNVTYQYNYNNRRVSKTVNGVTTYFIYNGHMLIGEYNEKAEPIKEYLYLNSTPIAILADNKTYKIYSDHLDTPRRVADSTGNIIWSWNSKPFGDTMADEDVDDNNQKFVMNLRFPGQYFDSETGTHYNINRDYNPLTGRYVQSDPIGFDGGLNTYLYANGNTILLVDLIGLLFEHKFKIYEKNFSIFGGRRPLREETERDLRKIFNTQRGKVMLKQLKKRRSSFCFWGWCLYDDDIVFEIHLEDYATTGSTAFGNVIRVGLEDLEYGIFYTSLEGHGTSEKQTLLRILAHELGHSAMGTLDDGKNQMNNVNLNENPIMIELGKSKRVAYL